MEDLDQSGRHSEGIWKDLEESAVPARNRTQCHLRMLLRCLTGWHGVKHSDGSQAEGHVHHGSPSSSEA
jgi:hypothetical protein